MDFQKDNDLTPEEAAALESALQREPANAPARNLPSYKMSRNERLAKKYQKIWVEFTHILKRLKVTDVDNVACDFLHVMDINLPNEKKMYGMIQRLIRAGNKPHWKEGESFGEVVQEAIDLCNYYELAQEIESENNDT